MRRHIILSSVCIAAQLTAGGAMAQAQDFPSRQIRFVSPYPPGGFNDTLARLIGDKMAASLGKPVVIDNRPGATSTIGATFVARSPADGYTIMMTGGGSHTISPSLNKLPYDTLSDFAGVSLVVYVPNMMVVHPSVPASTIRELVTLLKSKPGQLNYASLGIGNSYHLISEMFQETTGTKMTHVPYKGAAQALLAIVSGEVQVYFGVMSSVLPHVRTGKLRALGVTTDQRSPALPDVPTIAESGLLPEFKVTPWYAVLAPGKTPAPIIKVLNAEVVKAIQAQDVREKLARDGAVAAGTSAEELDQVIRREITMWAKVIKSAGIKGE